MANTTPKDTFSELRTMVTDYARQETVEPLQNLARWSALGVAGAVMLFIGALLTGVGILRLVQTMEWAQGKWNFAPYFILVLILAILAGLCFSAMGRTPDWLKDDNDL